MCNEKKYSCSHSSIEFEFFFHNTFNICAYISSFVEENECSRIIMWPITCTSYNQAKRKYSIIFDIFYHFICIHSEFHTHNTVQHRTGSKIKKSRPFTSHASWWVVVQWRLTPLFSLLSKWFHFRSLCKLLKLARQLFAAAVVACSARVQKSKYTQFGWVLQYTEIGRKRMPYSH